MTLCHPPTHPLTRRAGRAGLAQSLWHLAQRWSVTWGESQAQPAGLRACPGHSLARPHTGTASRSSLECCCLRPCFCLWLLPGPIIRTMTTPWQASFSLLLPLSHCFHPSLPSHCFNPSLLVLAVPSPLVQPWRLLDVKSEIINMSPSQASWDIT